MKSIYKNQKAKEVVEKLGYSETSCLRVFSTGILVKLMCVAPEIVKRSVMLVPSTIQNAYSIKSINMTFPMFMYRITNDENWFLKCILPMALKKENISKDILITARCSIDNT